MRNWPLVAGRDHDTIAPTNHLQSKG